MTFQEIKDQDQSYILHTYGRVDASLVKGRNARAWDTEGKEYIDFTSGIGVNALGYSDPAWASAVAAPGSGDSASVQLLLQPPEYIARRGTVQGFRHGEGVFLQFRGRSQ